MITRLFAVELRRLAYRRAAKVVLLVLVGLTLFVFGNEFRTSRNLSDAELDRIPNEFVQDPGSQVPAELGEEEVSPGEVQYFFEDPRFVFREEMPGLATGIGGMVAVAAFVFGATAGGADWSAGTVQALLFWEPRRVRVMLAKVAALTAAILAVAFVMQVTSYGLGSLVASARGNFEGVDGEFWRELAGRSVRISLVGVFTGLLAFGIAGFTRNTGAALGVGFVYFALLEPIVRGTLPRFQPYLVNNNIEAWVLDGATILIPRTTTVQEFYNSGNRGAFVLALYLTIVLGVMIATFARRDVT